MDTMQESLQLFNYHSKPIKTVKIKSNEYSDWENSMRDNLSPHIIASILILPGVKGEPNALYAKVKNFLLQEIPVPN